MDRQIDEQIDGQINRWIDRQIDRQIDGQMDRQVLHRRYNGAKIRMERGETCGKSHA